MTDRTEPAWWAEARALYDAGYPVKAIARLMGRHQSRINYALDLGSYRAAEQARQARRNESGIRRNRSLTHHEAGAGACLVANHKPRDVQRLFDREAVLAAVRASGGAIPTRALVEMMRAGA